MSIDVRRAVGNFGAFAVMRLGTALASFLFFVFLARSWSQEELGEFTTVLSIFLILHQLPLLGLHVPVVRELAQRPARAGELAGSLLALGLVAALVIGLLLGAVGTMVYPASMRAALWLVSLSMLPSAVSALAETVLLSRERMGAIAAVNGIELVVRTAAWCLLVWAGAGITALAATLVAGRLLTMVLYLHDGLGRLLWRSRIELARMRSLVTLAPVYLGLLALATAISRLDFVVLSQMAGLDQVGLYSAPYKIYEAGMMVPTILVVVIFPGVARLSARSAAAVDAVARQLCRIWVTVGLPAAVAGIALAAPTLRLLFGDAFAPAAPALAWLAVAPVIASVDITMSCVLQAAHRQTHDLRALALSFAVYLVALVTLIPLFGYVGAAAATAVGALVQAWLRYRAARASAGMSPLGAVLLPPLLAGLAMAGVIALLGAAPRIHALALGLGAYLLVLSATRGVSAADLRWLRGVLRQGSPAA